MVDSGASTTFISRRFVQDNHVATQRLDRPIPLFNIDGTLNRDGTISEVAILGLQIGDHVEKVIFMVTDIGSEDVIVGLDWLRKHNPEVHWDQGTLRLLCCPETCLSHLRRTPVVQTTTRDTRARPTTRRKSQQSGRTPKVGRVLAAVTVKEVEESDTEQSVWDGSED